MSDVTFDMETNSMEVHQKHVEPWKVTLVNTGINTMTGGRLKRVKEYLDSQTFCFTYGDGVSNIDLNELISFHKQNKKLATLSAVQPPGRYGALEIENKMVQKFMEKPEGDGGWINGGFFILEPKVIDYIKDDTTIWEREPLEKLSSEDQLGAFKHQGFWQPLDTLRDKNHLEKLWNENKALWKTW